MNRKIKSFEETIIKDINESGLPVEVVKYILLHILTLVEAESVKAIEQEELQSQSASEGEENHGNAESS